jgi:hypothetical protein
MPKENVIQLLVTSRDIENHEPVRIEPSRALNIKTM